MNLQHEDQLRLLTEQAVQASESGDWDQVIRLYNRRAREFPLDKSSPSLATQLLEQDSGVFSRIRLAKLALATELESIQAQKRRLQQMKQSVLGSARTGTKIYHAV